MAFGRATAVEGGYRLTGRWSWASGIRHCDWLQSPALVNGTNGSAGELRIFVFPAEQAQLYDNWNVMGLKGTGSCDFSITDMFVPEEFTFSAQAPVIRGGPLFRMGWVGFVASGMAAFSIAQARRALDEITGLAKTKIRGYTRKTTLADRSIFQKTLAVDELRLRSVRLLTLDVLDRAWQSVPEVSLNRRLRLSCAAPPPMPAKLRSKLHATPSNMAPALPCGLRAQSNAACGIWRRRPLIF
jgi:indole-3-acetate monooxygenase